MLQSAKAKNVWAQWSEKKIPQAFLSFIFRGV